MILNQDLPNIGISKIMPTWSRFCNSLIRIVTTPPGAASVILESCKCAAQYFVL